LIYFSPDIVIHKKITFHTYERGFSLVILQSVLIHLI
jgi:hypothetical protein